MSSLHVKLEGGGVTAEFALARGRDTRWNWLSHGAALMAMPDGAGQGQVAASIFGRMHAALNRGRVPSTPDPTTGCSFRDLDAQGDATEISPELTRALGQVRQAWIAAGVIFAFVLLWGGTVAWFEWGSANSLGKAVLASMLLIIPVGAVLGLPAGSSAQAFGRA